MTRYGFTFAAMVALVAAFLPATSSAETLDIQQELSQPGVKLDGEVIGKTPIQKRPVSPKECKGCWVDPQTKLIWQNPPAVEEMNWKNVIDYCKNLSLAGFSDWRLPNNDELKTILTESEGSAGCFWKEGLKGKCSWYWTSLSAAGDTGYAWCVDFRYGILSSYYKDDTLSVRCVRLSQVAEKQTTEVPAVLKIGGVGSVDSRGIEWMSIPAGSFMMGCSPGDIECGDREKPRHSVNVKGFQMMATEVTQGQYQSVIGANPSNFKNCGSTCPVEQVNWNEAKAFCSKIGGRLPTEAEWEYAARAGTGTKFYCGDNRLDSDAWFNENSGSKTHPAKQKQPNAWGLYDMLGNVWEWVDDCYSKDYNASPDCSLRVLRGGSWYYVAWYERVSNRDRNNPDARDNDIGFRCSRDEN